MQSLPAQDNDAFDQMIYIDSHLANLSCFFLQDSQGIILEQPIKKKRPSTSLVGKVSVLFHSWHMLVPKASGIAPLSLRTSLFFVSHVLDFFF